MKKTQETKQLMENIVIQLYNNENFCESRLLEAQKFYIEGEKRRLRYMSVEYHELIRYLTTSFFDIYGVHLNCEHKPQTYATISGIPDFFKKTLIFFEDNYDTLHEYANALMPCLAYNYACILLKHCNQLSNIIIEYKRIIGDGDACSWNESYIQRLLSKEQTFENIHDKYENKENEIGYKYH